MKIHKLDAKQVVNLVDMLNNVMGDSPSTTMSINHEDKPESCDDCTSCKGCEICTCDVEETSCSGDCENCRNFETFDDVVEEKINLEASINETIDAFNQLVKKFEGKLQISLTPEGQVKLKISKDF